MGAHAHPESGRAATTVAATAALTAAAALTVTTTGVAQADPVESTPGYGADRSDVGDGTAYGSYGHRHAQHADGYSDAADRDYTSGSAGSDPALDLSDPGRTGWYSGTDDASSRRGVFDDEPSDARSSADASRGAEAAPAPAPQPAAVQRPAPAPAAPAKPSAPANPIDTPPPPGQVRLIKLPSR